MEQLCSDPAAVKMVTADLNAIGKGKLGGNEALATVVLLPGTAPVDDKGPNAPWTPENGCVRPQSRTFAPRCSAVAV